MDAASDVAAPFVCTHCALVRDTVFSCYAQALEIRHRGDLARRLLTSTSWCGVMP